MLFDKQKFFYGIVKIRVLIYCSCKYFVGVYIFVKQIEKVASSL